MIYTTNAVESLHRSLRKIIKTPEAASRPPRSRRSCSTCQSRTPAFVGGVPNGFGEKPVLKLMFGALVRAAERWRGLRFIEFEFRQIAAVRKDLDAEYDATITRSDRPSQTRVSSTSAS